MLAKQRIMESEILQQLELIRVYVFVIMVAIVLWALFKIIESVQNVFIGFKKAWDASFNNRMEKLMDIGKYDKIINECKDVLQKHPNHIDAVWYTAKAFYYTGDNEASKEYFDKAIYLVPSWDETATVYLNELKNR